MEMMEDEVICLSSDFDSAELVTGCYLSSVFAWHLNTKSNRKLNYETGHSQFKIVKTEIYLVLKLMIHAMCLKWRSKTSTRVNTN